MLFDLLLHVWPMSLMELMACGTQLVTQFVCYSVIHVYTLIVLCNTLQRSAGWNDCSCNVSVYSCVCVCACVCVCVCACVCVCVCACVLLPWSLVHQCLPLLALHYLWVFILQCSHHHRLAGKRFPEFWSLARSGTHMSHKVPVVYHQLWLRSYAICYDNLACV